MSQALTTTDLKPTHATEGSKTNESEPKVLEGQRTSRKAVDCMQPLLLERLL